MKNIENDYVYIPSNNKKMIHSKKNDYTIIETVDKERKLSHQLLFSKMNRKNLYIPIEKKFFLNNLNTGFTDDEMIWDQFLKDIDRSRCYLNNNLIKSSNIIYFQNFLKSNNISENKKNIILMLCTQAVLAYPFEIIQRSLNNQFLSEINKKNSNYLQIKLFEKNEDITFYIKKCMRVFKFDKDDIDITVGYIIIELEFNLDSDEYITIKVSPKKIRKI